MIEELGVLEVCGARWARSAFLRLGRRRPGRLTLGPDAIEFVCFRHPHFGNATWARSGVLTEDS